MEPQEVIRERMHRAFEEYLAAEQELIGQQDDHFRVCIFGSARIAPSDPTYEMVRTVARTLASLGIDIVTGGGPGLMAAANQGEKDAKMKGVLSIGLPIVLPRWREAANSHLDIKSEHSRFSTRLDEFMSLSHAVVVAPGGIGTMLELSYVWQLVQVQLIPPRAVVLLGREFWGGLLEWMRNQQLRRNFIEPGDLDFVHLADTAAEVLDLIHPELKKFQERKHDSGEHPEAAEAARILSVVGKEKEAAEHHRPLPGIKG